MLELQGTVTKLKPIIKFYADKINSNQFFVVHPKDSNTINQYLEKLIVQVVEYSPNLAQSLRDIRQNLFVFQPQGVTFNPFRFGSLQAILSYLSSNDFIGSCFKFINSPWVDVNEAVKKILIDATTVDNRLDYNQVGVAARELYIMLAKKVFDKSIHTSPHGKEISDSDAKAMLEAFLVYNKIQNDELKKYSLDAVKLAETVTHMKTTDKKRLNALVIAVISVVGIVSIIYQK